jgi:arylsulfatase A-like enzyme
MGSGKPNLVYVFADQWRAQSSGYAGNQSVRTPHLDRLSRESVNFTNAVSGCPVCSPARAGMITGRYPLTHGIFMNDLYLNRDAVSIADACRAEGYDTAYVGKWHLDGHGRSTFIPRERRQGFDFWRVLECTHRYNESYYYGDGPAKLKWDGYDAIAQTAEASRYISEHDPDSPFMLFLSWGPPHNPYQTAPEEYRSLYNPEDLVLRPNVPEDAEEAARVDLAGYYAHITALDDCIGSINETLQETGQRENTVFVFTSDHGDMHGSHGCWRKQYPWDESILVPFVLRYPDRFGRHSLCVDTPINTPDIMPTLLGICGIEIPGTVEGIDYSGRLGEEEEGGDDAALIACYVPFGEWLRREGAKEYRGLRTRQYTYVRTLQGPWLLYDNLEDPYQQMNLCNDTETRELQLHLDAMLQRKLVETGDDFASSEELIARYGITTDKAGTVPYTN